MYTFVLHKHTAESISQVMIYSRAELCNSVTFPITYIKNKLLSKVTF